MILAGIAFPRFWFDPDETRIALRMQALGDLCLGAAFALRAQIAALETGVPRDALCELRRCIEQGGRCAEDLS
jgi:hypothetical protein